MEKRSFSLWQFVGFSLTSLLGTLLHFLYDFSGKNPFAALFSGVNESTWEHMKLLFFSLFFFAIIEYFFFSERENFWCVKLKGTLLGLGLIPVIFYTYRGVLGKNVDFINILIFFVSAAAVFLYETREMKKEKDKCPQPRLSFILLCLIMLSFFLFTFFPPKIGLFLDPITGTYGV